MASHAIPILGDPNASPKGFPGSSFGNGNGGIFGGGDILGDTITAATIAAAIAARAGQPISGPSDPRVLYGGMRPNSGGGYDYFNPDMAGMMTSAGSSGNSGTTVIVNAGTIATPDELVILIKTAIQDLNRAGDSTTFAGAIA
jgi:hypothetical protein